MTWLIVLGAVLLALTALNLMRCGLSAEYKEGVFRAMLHAGPVKIRLADSGKSKKAKKPKKKKESAAAKAKSNDTEQKPKRSALEQVRVYYNAAAEAASRMNRHIRIDWLYLDFCMAGDDPFDTALGYGASCAGVGGLLPVLERHFKLRDYRIRTSVSFTEEKPKLNLNVKLTLSVWEFVYIILRAAKKLPKRSKQTKGETSDGKKAA